MTTEQAIQGVAKPKRRPYNASASLSEYGVFPECDAAPAAQAPRACTCHPDDRPDGPCRERYAASECQALAAQAPAAYGDALEDYKENGAAAVRFAPSSAHWSNELRRLFGPDARDGIDRLEERLRAAEQDAARYRWLRARWGRIADEYDGDSDQLVAIREADSHFEGWDVDPLSLDRAIDTAIAAEKKENSND